ncbi:MAG: hypothetical protein ABIU95_00275, partial [Burkholderiales bacterium]
PLAVHATTAVGALVHAATADLACNWKTYVEHRFAATPDFQFQWPLVFVASIGAATYVEQITPRSFLRTRIASYLFGEGTEGAQAAALAASAKEGAEVLQKLREAADETTAAGGGEVAAFRAQVRAVIR